MKLISTTKSLDQKGLFTLFFFLTVHHSLFLEFWVQVVDSLSSPICRLSNFTQQFLVLCCTQWVVVKDCSILLIVAYSNFNEYFSSMKAWTNSVNIGLYSSHGQFSSANQHVCRSCRSIVLERESDTCILQIAVHFSPFFKGRFTVGKIFWVHYGPIPSPPSLQSPPPPAPPTTALEFCCILPPLWSRWTPPTTNLN